MKHYGDITKINGAEVEPVWIITGGSPCQDLSIAGRRAGLDGERSGLFMEQIRIIKEMREYDRAVRGTVDDIRCIRPRFMVWENVPGAFSSNNGEDFRIVLEETAKVADKDAVIPRPDKGKWSPSGCIMGNGWSIAWRVHDAQFWGKTIRDVDTGDVLTLGTPQRRRRIALVADFGGGSAPEILFERKSLSGDSEPISETRENTSTLTEENIRNSISFQERAGCAGGGKGLLIQNERTGALSTLQNQYVLPNECIGFNRERCGAVTMNDAMPTLQAAAGESGNNQPMVVIPNSTGANPTVINIETEVEVRKYPVDKERLIDCLQAHKNKSIKEIADALQKPRTLVEHWFRKDSYFAIPDADIWFELKEMLGIDTDEFDESIMTFETKPGNFDMQNRIYVGETSPTITANQNHFHWVDDKSTMCIGNGQLHDALSPSVEVCKTLNCMDDPMKIMTYETDQHTFSQDSYDQLSANDVSASLKADGGNYGGGQRSIGDTIGALCARDYKGVGSQYVDEGKCVIDYQ